MLQFRKITKEDIPALYDLIMKIARHHSQEQYVNTTEKELMQYGFGENPKYGALVAETDGKLVGYLSYTWNYSIWQGTEYMNLDDLYVDGEYRNQKIGQQLMDLAREVCVKRGIHVMKWEVEEENSKAIKFYERLGAEMRIKGIFKWKFNS